MVIETILRRKSAAYQKVFNKKNKDAEIVLADLRRICPSNADADGKDTNAIMINIGKRKVLNHIISMLGITEEELAAIFKKEQKITQEQNND